MWWSETASISIPKTKTLFLVCFTLWDRAVVWKNGVSFPLTGWFRNLSPKNLSFAFLFSCTVSRESMTAIAMVAVWALTGMSQWAFVPTNHCINTHKKVQLVFRGRGGTCLRGVRWWVDHIAVASAMLGRAKNNRLQKQFLLISQSAGKLPKNGAFFARRCGENGGKPSLWSLLVANVCFTTHVESWNSSLLIKSQN